MCRKWSWCRARCCLAVSCWSECTRPSEHQFYLGSIFLSIILEKVRYSRKKNEYFYRPSTVWRAHEWVVRMDSRRGHQNRRHFWCQPTQEAAGDRADAHSMHPTAFLFFKFLSGNQHDLIEYTTTLKSCSISRGFTAGKRTSTKVEQGWKTLHGITEVWKFE